MDTKGLLFIPDISGFTRFVSQIEIAHSRTIIQELLETLINANQLDLTISEIEGDAILFYKFGESPALGDIYRQVEKMFTAFHRQLALYEIRKYCQCTACTSAIDLSLKVITHFGEFTGYNVKNFSKLIGKDVIVAHQLLKNDIEQHEYWLVTDALCDKSPVLFKSWMKWDALSKDTENGKIPFHYTQLSPLKNEIPPAEPLRLELKDKVKMFSVTKDFAAHIFTAFHATGDFQFRHQWRDGITRAEEVDHFLPRVGMKYKCWMGDKEVVLYSSSYAFQPTHIEFSETDESKTHSYYYTLDQIDDQTTRVTIDYYLPRHPLKLAVFKLTQERHLISSLEQSMVKLGEVIRQLRDVQAQ
jgi:hypothetical protein